MAVNISKKVKVTKGKATKADDAAKGAGQDASNVEAQDLNAEVEVTKGGKVKQTAVASGITKSFLKTGLDAQEALAEEDAKIDNDKSLRPDVRTFWMKPESETIITFLDGDLNAEHGMLDAPLLYNHNVFNADMGTKGERIDIACIRDTGDACPLCDHDKPTLVAVFTIVEHIEYESGGEIVTNPRRIFMCKRSTLRDMQEAATALGGLRGAQFRVRRTGKRKATVGDEFDYLGKLTEEQMIDAFDEPNAVDYEKTLVCLSADELYERGVVAGVMKGLANGNSGYDVASGGVAQAHAYSQGKAAGEAPKKGQLPNSFEDQL